MIGSAAALVVFAVQCTRLVRRKVSAVFPGVLPLVTPMVAATNAAQLGHPLPGSVFFFASLLTALPAFARVYNSAGRRPAGGEPVLVGGDLPGRHLQPGHPHTGRRHRGGVD